MFERSEWDDAFVRGTKPSAEVMLARTFGELWAREMQASAADGDRVSTLFELSPVALLELRSNGHVISANASAQRLLAISLSGALVDHLEPLGSERILQVARAARLHGRAIAALDHRERRYHVEAIAHHDAQRVLLSLVDSEHVMAQGEAERSARALRSILRAAREGVALLDHGQVLYANEAWYKLTGATHCAFLEEVVEGKSLSARLEELAASDSGQTIDVRLGEGTSNEVLAELTAVFVEYQEQRCVLVMARDLTARRRLEARVARSERLASLGMLVAGVAHEINNPLTYVLANLESLAARVQVQGGLLAEEDANEALRDAIDGCQRIAAIIRELRSFYRADDQEIARVDPNQVVRDAARIVAGKCAAAARLDMDLGQVPRVLGIQTSLVQVLINLIVNAVDAMPPERATDQNVIRVSTGTRGNDVRIEVADNGRGIPPAELSRIFEPFFSRGKATGTGLGLTISRNLVEQLNGWIDVQSRVGSGTRFIVHLEAAAAEKKDSADSEDAALLPISMLSELRILVVDDEPLVARSVARLLAQAHEIVCVHSVASAMDVLGLRDDIDIVISDWVMPDGGAQALIRHMAHRGRQNLPFVVMTGLGQIGGLDPIDGPCVRKPVSQSALLQAVAEALASPNRGSMVVRTGASAKSAEYPAVNRGEELQERRVALVPDFGARRR
ncbi:MAG: hybrid sensor histidine kinase/response regulator [Myxococcota bacterium]